MNKYLASFALVIALTCLGLEIWDMRQSQKVGYVVLSTVYDEFNYSKELLANHEKTNKQVINEKDSLSKLLKSLVNEKDQYRDTAGVVGFYLRALNERVQNLEELLNKDMQRVNEKIFNQINKEIERFGKKKSYRLILGATGDGSIMYAAEAANYTQDFIQFINTTE